MIDRQTSGDALNSYNVAQLHLALTQDSKDPGIDTLPFDVHGFHPLSGAASPVVLSTPATSDGEFDYTARRMSSSAASDSSFQSRPEKRAPDLSPSTSPAPKKARADLPLDSQSWVKDQDDRSNYSSPRVQLPSITSTFQESHELRRASLPTLYSESSSNRLRLPNPALRSSQSSSGLSSYQFPPNESDERRPRLAADTQLGAYPDYSVPSTALSSNSSFSFPGNSPLSGAPSSAISVADADHWASGIVRPSSTPNQVPGALLSPKYDDSLRHSSIGTQNLYGGVTRISGHSNSSSDRSTSSARNGLAPSVKSESEWNFPGSTDFSSMNPPSTTTTMSSTTAAPSIAVSSSPQRSPQTQPQPPTASLADRPPRKRGKLPKPVTDFLKDWLHRHSDHPYPSEDEKKQLCNATGLSMSQVSNWMINARRRILAPAHRAAAAPTTNQPYSTRGPGLLDTSRRASMPTDSLQLYYPLSLQSLPEPHMPSTRQMVGVSRSLSTNHSTVGSLSSAGSHGHHPYLDSSYATARLSYGSGTQSALHPSQHTSSTSSYIGVPLSAPASLSSGSFLHSGSHSSQSLYSNSTSSYSSRGLVVPESGARYTFADTHAQSVSPQPGSGYHTPQ